MNTDDIWYYARSDGSAVGPLSRLEMVRLTRANKINGQTLVWNNDDYEWRPLAKTVIALDRNTIEESVDDDQLPQWQVGEPFEPIVPPAQPRANIASDQRRRRREAVRHQQEQREKLQRQQSSPPPAPRRESSAATAPSENKATDPAAGERVGWAVRRWCARLFDACSIALVALAVLLVLLHRLDAAVANSLLERLSVPLLVVPAAMLAWVPFEALAITLFGTTPGKALWGIRVGSAEQPNLGPFSSLQRSISVLVRGLFLGIPPVTLLSQGWAMISLINQGETSWDRSSGSIVEYAKLDSRRIMIGLVLLVAAIVGVIEGQSWRAVLSAVAEFAGMF